MTKFKKGDKLVLIEEGKEIDKGFYFIDEFDEDGQDLIFVGGMGEEFVAERDKVKLKQSSNEEKIINILVDLSSCMRSVVEKLDHLIPKCPDCGNEMECCPTSEHDGLEEDEPNEDGGENKLN